ncbi:MAG: hypothetical protein JSV04_11430 [Candidatus Heimdallarchaeota archaeon]|nr:MAG: hypothetical protein JSV04_11430 [Candidatus Heimdallarchaeota archaeon]
MSEKGVLDYVKTILQYRRAIAFGLSLIVTTIIDLTIPTTLPFWLSPLMLGIIGGFIVGSASAGLFTGLGTLVGRFVSILIMILTMPGLLRTLDLFLLAIGDVLGASLPPGSLIIILLSVLICGLFGLFGGITGGSVTVLVQYFRESSVKEEV